MRTPTLAGSPRTAELWQRDCEDLTLLEERSHFVESPRARRAGARGALVGVLLGVGVWGAILMLILKH